MCLVVYIFCITQIKNPRNGVISMKKGRNFCLLIFFLKKKIPFTSKTLFDKQLISFCKSWSTYTEKKIHILQKNRKASQFQSVKKNSFCRWALSKNLDCISTINRGYDSCSQFKGKLLKILKRCQVDKLNTMLIIRDM